MLRKLLVFFQIQKGLLLQYGWIVSWWKGKPVDRHGEPLPWLTYPSIDFLAQFDYSNAVIFEWGSGFSTLWWAKRCKKITTVQPGGNDENRAWISYLKPKLPDSVRFITPEFTKESEASVIEEKGRVYDVIVIDNHGPFRSLCAEKAMKHLIEGGILILDNSDQCPKAVALLRKAGFCQIDFTGFLPCNGYAQCTSIFFKQTIGLPAISENLPIQSVAQPNPPWENC